MPFFCWRRAQRLLGIVIHQPTGRALNCTAAHRSPSSTGNRSSLTPPPRLACLGPLCSPPPLHHHRLATSPPSSQHSQSRPCSAVPRPPLRPIPTPQTTNHHLHHAHRVRSLRGKFRIQLPEPDCPWSHWPAASRNANPPLAKYWSLSCVDAARVPIKSATAKSLNRRQTDVLGVHAL
ncbi:uncharacterized protein J3D65DRAFT_2901 [Phyllosticta citribraziliensis]|uniref:Uncharacterized protein n=1 Tax=Phyllosticta citribraziliensis TaxID=989973 RepID=A0ABR1M827_9PEZI